MKKVIIESQPVDVVLLNDVNHCKYYGMVVEGTKSKGFIAREKYNYGDFRVFTMHQITKGNYYPQYTSSSLETTISSMVDREGISVYEFDTSSELFEWLSK